MIAQTPATCRRFLFARAAAWRDVARFDLPEIGVPSPERCSIGPPIIVQDDGLKAVLSRRQ
jgi:hypothetical protein